MNDEVYFFHAYKQENLLQLETIILGECNQACLQYSKKIFITLQYLHKSMVDDVDFLPEDKHKSFLQDDSITLGVLSQICPEYQKKPVYNIFAISQGKHEG